MAGSGLLNQFTEILADQEDNMFTFLQGLLLLYTSNKVRVREWGETERGDEIVN